ncbi:ATP-binding protein [Pendulispora brunnea]|uniref:histidine kinase n=1 Tax=Pendulispora brunnea TaxID=2905690 RepID=A0ABZ2KK07_9BACT
MTTIGAQDLSGTRRTGAAERTTDFEERGAGVGGVGSVHGRRHLRFLTDLRELMESLESAESPEDACALTVEALVAGGRDVMCAFAYLVERDGDRTRLVARSGPAWVHDATIVLRQPALRGALEVIGDLDRHLMVRERTALNDVPRVGLSVPAKEPRGDMPRAVLVVGLTDPASSLEGDMHAYLDLVATQLGSRIGRLYAEEQQRARSTAFAARDRAKTDFVGTVSHEFRTPLTLVLGPVDDAIDDETLPKEHRARLGLVRRNAQRLAKLADTLLDFSRVETGRVDAVFHEVDLPALTADLASAFRSAIEKAGLRLVVDLSPMREATFVDHDMWEKIVLNLLSNALKFTFEGEIRLSLRERDGHIQLCVSDTGSGIPEAEIGRVFERFHRVSGVRGRTQEGTGIGLALVKDLVKIHGGDICVASSTQLGAGNGTTFTVKIPTGSLHLPQSRVSRQQTSARASAGVATYVEEALRWLPGSDEKCPSTRPPASTSAPGTVATAAAPTRARILLADDNADIRSYMTRLLGKHWDVTAVADGQAALEAARANRPDLILSDVMMPRLDGFALLRAIREDSRLKTTPVILLTARAGQESTVEGFAAGADDYVLKPFSARELVARVRTHLELSNVRRQSEMEQETARTHAERLNRMKDEFLATVSHELRTPLQAILGWVKLLSDGQVKPERVAKAIDVIERNARAQAQLIEDILDVSRIIAGKIRLDLKPVDMVAVVNGAIDTVRPAAQKKQIEIVATLGPALGGVVGDADRLQQVVWNLLSNAVKFTPAGGKVAIFATMNRGRVEVRVTDTGEGINPAFLPHVFERFRQADGTTTRSQGGLGLGLAIVRHIVELHGGTVEADSEGSGKGASFAVNLPVRTLMSTARFAERDSGTHPTAAVARRLDGKRILVVDDEEDARDLLMEVLKENGAESRGARSVAEALSMIDEFRPDVILSDIGMPVDDGYSLIRRLRAIEAERKSPPIPALALTAYAREADRRMALEAGYQMHVPKPVEPSALVEAIARWAAPVEPLKDTGTT